MTARAVGGTVAGVLLVKPAAFVENEPLFVILALRPSFVRVTSTCLVELKEA